MHVSSTGTLVIFSPRVSASQEAMWYALYGSVLRVIAGVIAMRWRSSPRDVRSSGSLPGVETPGY
jgi:hypothetical protein